MTDTGPIVLGRDDVGIIAEGDGMRYYLTECCLASAKGMADCVGCRGCYTEIDPALGGLPPQSGPVPEPFGDGLPYETYKARHDHAKR